MVFKKRKMELMRENDNADTISIDTFTLEKIMHEEEDRENNELHKLSKNMAEIDFTDTISIDTFILEKDLNEERYRENDALCKLSKKVCCFHTNMLYYRQLKTKVGVACFDIWKAINKRVGGSPNAWRELGANLGITQDDLNYIGNSIKEHHTDTVLKVFMQSEDATLDKIINAFIKMERYDILKSVEGPLLELTNLFNKEDSKSDTGYHSGPKLEENKQIISLTDIPNDLPPVLRSINSILDEKPPEKNKPEEKKPCKVLKKVRNDTPVLLLTFAEDGQETALNIQDKINNWPEDCPTVTVLTLNNNKEDVLQRPESFIRQYFEKADYVVPIITLGYLEAIKKHAPNSPNIVDNLDYKYVHFIYMLIVNHYIHVTGCFNKKVRSVIPQNMGKDMFNIMTEINMYPDLLPWTNEEVFDEIFQGFLKKEFS